MRSRAFAVVLVLLLAAALALWRLRTPFVSSGGGAGSASEPKPSGSSSATNTASPGKDPLPVPDPPSAKWRGLRLLVAGAAAADPEHPWTEYIRKREATREEWSHPSINLDLKDTPLSDLPGVFSAGAGLAVRVDPLCAPQDKTTTFKISELAADQALDLIVKMAGLRTTVGSDGVMWVVPPDGRAACEPEFIDDLRRWENAARRRVPSDDSDVTPPETLKSYAAQRERVEIVNVPFRDALTTLSKTFGLRILVQANAGTADATEALYKSSVTLVHEAVTMEEALREILAPVGKVCELTRNNVIIRSQSELEEEVKRQLEHQNERRKKAAVLQALRNRLIRLDGSFLTAQDIAVEAAKQAGIGVMLDPLLSASAARWEAVDAELTLGALMEALAAGAKCACELHEARWPGFDPEIEGWTLWLFSAPPVSPK